MKRLECLDGLRGVLAAYVMLSHMAPFALLPGWLAALLSHGGAAVDVFFILSGLVIVRSLEGFDYRARPFLLARMVRIFPAFLALFALAVAVQPIPSGFARMGWIAMDSPARAIWSDGWPHAWLAEIAAHLTMTHGLVPNGVLPDAWVSFLGAAWSLSTEWQFYLLALLLGRRFGASASALLLVAIAGQVWVAAAPDPWQFSRAFLGNKAGYFALGVASAALVRAPAAEPARGKGPTGFAGSWRYRPGIGLFGARYSRYPWDSRYIATLLAVLALCWRQGGADKLLPPLLWTLCLAAELRPAWGGLAGVSALLRVRPLQWLGALSYSLYLANEPVQKLLGVGLAMLTGGDARVFTLLWLPGAAGLPVLAAMASRRWIELPALRRFRPTPVHASATRLYQGQ